MPRRAWSPWPWVITARGTGSHGSMWNSPGGQYRPSGRNTTRSCVASSPDRARSRKGACCHFGIWSDRCGWGMERVSGRPRAGGGKRPPDAPGCLNGGLLDDRCRKDPAMSDLPPFDTHVVANQPPEFAPRDLWLDDVALRDALRREGGQPFADQIAAYGGRAGGELYGLSFDAHRDRPRLRTHDRFGHRIDRVEFHPHYHALMQAAIEQGVAGLSWREAGPGAHVARAALSYLHHQVEPGTSCPLTMTHAAVPVLRREPSLHEWAAKAIATHYDASDVPITGKSGV